MYKRISLFLAAALVVAACNSGTSGKTLLTGKFGEDAPAEIHIKAAGIDTVIAVDGKTFTFEAPVDLVSVATAGTENGQIQFISDGSKLTLDFSGDKPTVTSNNPKSATSRMNAFREKAREMNALIRAEEDEEKSEELYEQFMDFNKETVLANADNFVGIAALQNIYYELEPDDLLEVLEGLSPAVRENSFVQNVTKAARAQLNTAEGKMFTDFEIEEKPGQVTKFSDFVGQGKYMLVDFWASWCGPCKREMPYIAAAYEKFHGDKFDVLSVAVWDEVADTEKAAPELGIVWNQIINGQRIPTEIYGIQGIPHLILFGPDGTILKRGLRGEAIQQELAKYLD